MTHVPYYQRIGVPNATPVALTTYLNRIESFRNPNGSMPETPRFRFPFEPAPRSAILLDGFRETLKTRVFPGGWCDAAANWNPEALAGPLPRLKALSNRILDRELSIPSLERAVIVLERLSGDWSTGRTLSAPDRDFLWQAFRVPIYVQYIGLGNELLAQECEALAGAHICPDAAEFSLAEDGRLTLTPFRNTAFPAMNLLTGVAADIDDSPCACGKTTPRLRGLRSFVRERVRTLAAAAAG